MVAQDSNLATEHSILSFPGEEELRDLVDILRGSDALEVYRKQWILDKQSTRIFQAVGHPAFP